MRLLGSLQTDLLGRMPESPLTQARIDAADEVYWGMRPYVERPPKAEPAPVQTFANEEDARSAFLKDYEVYAAGGEVRATILRS